LVEGEGKKLTTKAPEVRRVRGEFGGWCYGEGCGEMVYDLMSREATD